MKVLLVAILACFGVNALADDHMDSDSPAVTPAETMYVYMDHFNNEDMDALNEMLEPPFFFVRGTDRGVYDKYEDFVDFQGLRNSGWNYSKIDSTDLIYEDPKTCMINWIFSRYDKDDNVTATQSVDYLLMNVNGVWKIKGAFTPTNFSTGQE